MRILITNDDGVDAPGMTVMREIAAGLSDDVWVVAPDGNQSGAGHRFSFGRELSMEQREPQVFAVHGGSPADCVAVGFTHLCKDHAPDVVLSGINNGQNLGDISNCSGTVAGARQAAMYGALGIAVSQSVDYAGGGVLDWGNSRRHGAAVISELIAKAQGEGVYYNVNIPFGDDVTGIRVVPAQRFARSPIAYYPSDNAGKFFITILETPSPLDPQQDFHQLLHERVVTVTPLQLQQTDAAVAAALDGQLQL